MSIENVSARYLQRKLERIGPSASIDRFLSGYGNVRTKAAYIARLEAYLNWLREKKGVTMSLDELILDNLRCISSSDPTDVLTKRRHTDWMGEHVNKYLIERGISESLRGLTTAAIRQFYLTNDSPLFGHFKQASQPFKVPPKPLFAEDIRKVLLAMSPRMRTLPLLVWQSGIEPNRLYGTKFPTDQALPVRIDLYGRKKHRRPYSTFIGRDSIEHLKQLGTRGLPNFCTVGENFRGAARQLGVKGLLKNPEPASWHIYALRHSFKIEAEHAGAKTPIIEYFLGHTGGIENIYAHRGEIHDDDLIREYQKIEPRVSLSPDETALRHEFEEKQANLWGLYQDAMQTLEKLRAHLQASEVSPSARQEAP